MQNASRRYLALWLHQLALDRWRRRDDPRLTGPFAIVVRRANAERIIVMNALAQQAGVQSGQALTDAYAICPDLLSEPTDPIRERGLLVALRAWLDRFSPTISIRSEDCLLLDITGCAHLFGGENSLATAIWSGLNDLKIDARIGVANTPMAAYGVAHYGPKAVHITQAHNEKPDVLRLPISALGIETKIVQTLARVGLTTIGDITGLRSAELARRFSVKVPEALDALMGQRFDPVVPNAVRRIFFARKTLPEPIGRTEHVEMILEELATRLCGDLVTAGQAARGYRLTVRCVDTGNHSLDIGFSTPMRDVGPILRQFRRPIDELSLPFGADGFRLEALNSEIFSSLQNQLGDDAAAWSGAFEQTLTTLGNRLGFDRVREPVPGAGHTPENEHATLPAIDAVSLNVGLDKTAHPRPEVIWQPRRIRVDIAGHPPLRFTYKGISHERRKAVGPERISPEWWHAPRDHFTSQTRDYWRVSTNQNRCFWLAVCPMDPDFGWFACGEFMTAPRFSHAQSA